MQIGSLTISLLSHSIGQLLSFCNVFAGFVYTKARTVCTVICHSALVLFSTNFVSGTEFWNLGTSAFIGSHPMMVKMWAKPTVALSLWDGGVSPNNSPQVRWHKELVCFKVTDSAVVPQFGPMSRTDYPICSLASRPLSMMLKQLWLPPQSITRKD